MILIAQVLRQARKWTEAKKTPGDVFSPLPTVGGVNSTSPLHLSLSLHRRGSGFFIFIQCGERPDT